ncbi:MAG: hypothetical protein J0L75_00870 [Spirochaetes bacterium]|nr:hypothetical protein [Spirochaetota bacterium]
MKKAIPVLLLLASMLSAGEKGADTNKPARFRIPHAFNFELGTKYNFSSTFKEMPAVGAFGAFEYAWQLSGFEGHRPAVYLGLPLRWHTMLSGSNAFGQSQILSYGFTIRHQLSTGRLRPFIAYNLLVNQFTPDALQTNLAGHPGRLMGHETKFDFGLELVGDKPAKGFAACGRLQISGSLTTFPSLTDPARSVWSLYASLGFWLL